jgi:hypothetical protein
VYDGWGDSAAFDTTNARETDATVTWIDNPNGYANMTQPSGAWGTSGIIRELDVPVQARWDIDLLASANWTSPYTATTPAQTDALETATILDTLAALDVTGTTTGQFSYNAPIKYTSTTEGAYITNPTAGSASTYNNTELLIAVPSTSTLMSFGVRIAAGTTTTKKLLISTTAGLSPAWGSVSNPSGFNIVTVNANLGTGSDVLAPGASSSAPTYFIVNVTEPGKWNQLIKVGVYKVTSVTVTDGTTYPFASATTSGTAPESIVTTYTVNATAATSGTAGTIVTGTTAGTAATNSMPVARVTSTAALSLDLLLDANANATTTYSVHSLAQPGAAGDDTIDQTVNGTTTQVAVAAGSGVYESTTPGTYRIKLNLTGFTATGTDNSYKFKLTIVQPGAVPVDYTVTLTIL